MIDSNESGAASALPAADQTTGQRIRSFYAMLVSLRSKWQSKEHWAPVLFTASSIWLSIAQLISGVIIVHYIAPRDMGLWGSVSLALTYAFFVLAGIQNGLSRELPYYLGADDEPMARRLAATALSYTMGGCVLAFVGGIASIVFLIWIHVDIRLTYAVAAVTALIIFKFYQNYLFVTFRSKNSFFDLARVQLWQGALMLLGLGFLLFGYGGLLLRFVVVAGLSVYLMHRARPMRVSVSWQKDSFFLLMKTGLPIFATDYIANCAGTFDKVALLRFGGVEQVGFYALAMSVYAAFQVVPQSIAHYIYPRMSHHYGRTNNPRILWSLAWRISLIVLASMIPIALVGCWLLPAGVRILFPKYMAGTHAAQIALFSAVAFGATTGSNALASLKAWSHLISYQFSFSALVAIAPFIGIRLFSSPLDGVAYGLLGANIIGAILSIAVTFAATHRGQSFWQFGKTPVIGELGSSSEEIQDSASVK
jgi:O-antigen/teichoic acid export membrane protein